MNVRPRLIVLLVLALLLGSMLLRVEAKTGTKAKMRDIADTVASTPILSKFNQMLQASDLVTFLSSRGPFTLFAPTDSAFSTLPPGTLETLLLPQNKERLQHIILFHVINGKRILAHDLGTTKSLISCEGNPLIFKKSRLGAQMVSVAKLVHGDIRCENGLIHQIDTLLMPPATSLPALVPAPVTPTAPPTGTNAAPVTE